MKLKVKWEHFCIGKERNYFIWSSFPCPKGTQEERFVLNILHQRVLLAAEDLHSQMENNFWELSTSKETFLWLEQGNHFAKLPGAASAPPGCLSSSHLSQAHRSRVGPSPAWCLEGGGSEMWRSAGEADVHSWVPGSGPEEGAEVPFSSLQAPPQLLWAEEVWGMRIQQAAGAGAKGVLGQLGCPQYP